MVHEFELIYRCRLCGKEENPMPGVHHVGGECKKKIAPVRRDEPFRFWYQGDD